MPDHSDLTFLNLLPMAERVLCGCFSVCSDVCVAHIFKWLFLGVKGTRLFLSIDPTASVFVFFCKGLAGRQKCHLLLRGKMHFVYLRKIRV